MIPLHLHTTFSFLDGYGTAKQYAKIFKEKQITAAAITDHGNGSGFASWEKELSNNGIKPIFGCEFYIVSSSKLNKREKGYNHVTVLAKTQLGYKNLSKLITMSYRSDQFYYRPRISWNQLLKCDGLIVLSGCPAGLLNSDKLNLTDKMRWLNIMCEKFEGDFYLEFHLNEFDVTKQMNETVFGLSRDFPIIVANDVHYPSNLDAISQDILWSIGQNKLMSDPNRYSYYKVVKDTLCVYSEKEMLERIKLLYGNRSDIMKLLEIGVYNTYEIAEKCNVKLEKAREFKFNYASKEENFELFKKLIKEGILKRSIKINEEYKTRIIREIKLIKDKSFIDYFLCVNDFVNHAKYNMNILVGPGRGSVGGSLISYLLGITEIDPIKHSLPIERFLDETRTDLPDIDLDFEDKKRDLVKSYLGSKYGSKQVADIITYSRYHGRSCIRDVCRVFEIPISEVEKLMEMLPEPDEEDERYFNTIEDTFANVEAKEILEKYPELKYAEKLEGQIRHYGKHAAGVVISTTNPLADFFPIYDNYLFSLDKKDSEKFGFLKIDILGLEQLTKLAKVRDNVYKKKGIKIDFYSIEFEDQKVLKQFEIANCVGVFQFEGETTKSLCKRYKPTKFFDLVILNALARPGPLESGGAELLIERKHSNEIPIIHPIYDKITKSNYGVIIFQEDVMQICRELALLDIKTTNEIRKAIAKSEGREKLEGYLEKFVNGCLSNDVNKEVAINIWEDIVKFGRYAFNKSHATLYSVISYWCQFCKVYYFEEFYNSILDTQDEMKKLKVLSVLIEMGYKIKNLHINKSTTYFSILSEDDKDIYPGFCDVKGIGSVNSEKIIKNQPYKNVSDFSSKSECGAHIKSKLMLLGAFGTEPKKEVENELCYWKRCNFVQLRTNVHLPINELVEGQSIRVIGKIIKMTIKYGEDKRPYCNMQVQDETGKLTCIISRNSYDKFRQKLLEVKVNDIIDIGGKVGMWKNLTMLYVDKVIE